MDFFRKLFPIRRKNMTQDNRNTHHIIGTELTPEQNSTQLVNSLNVGESIFKDNEDTMKDDAELDFNKTVCTLENVAPIKICPNITQIGSKMIEISDHFPKDILALDTSFSDKANVCIDVSDVITSNNKIHFNNEPLGTKYDDKMSNENIILNITDNTVIDDNTLQNLKEFEETLNNLDKTAFLSNVPGEELIDLDEFNDILDKLETQEDLNDQTSPARNNFEQNNDTDVCNSTLDNIKNSTGNVNNSENNSKRLDNIDIISLTSSTEEEKTESNDTILETISINSNSQEAQDSDCDGYNSSDFEFISETEANMDGYIINFRSGNNQGNDKLSEESSEPLSSFFSQDEGIGDNKIDLSPGEGPSGLNRQKHEFEDRSYRNNHVIPVGEDYLGLFQGIYNPLLPISEIFFLENKSVRASAMNVQYDGIGFDKQLALRRPQRDSSEDEFEDDAEECAKKILNMYPGENRKRRRRY